MIEHILSSIVGYAALGLFTIGLFEWYRSHNISKKEELQKALNVAKHAEINAEIKKLNEAEIDKQKAYESAKGKVYEILAKRNPSGSNINSSDESGRKP